MKMTDSEYEEWKAHISLSPENKALVGRIRISEPTRQSSGFGGSVRGRYPSLKMDHMVAYDSHTVELSWIYLAEHASPWILEYYEQPFPITLHWKDDKGKQRSATYTPDFFVIERDRCYYVECKTDEFLEEDAIKHPGRYVCIDGVWSRPAAVEAAKLQGFGHVVWTPTKEIRLARNTAILDDYGTQPLAAVPQDLIEKTQAMVKERGHVSLQDLEAKVTGLTADHLHIIIFHGAIFVDLRKDLLTAREATHAYESQAMAETLAPAIEVAQQMLVPESLEITEGATIEWDGNRMTITVVTDENVFLDYDGRVTQIALTEFLKLVKKGTIKGASSPSDGQTVLASGIKMLLEADKEDKAVAVRRQQAIDADDGTVNPRTLARWKAAALKAQATIGLGILGLLPGHGANRKPRVEPLVRQTAIKVIKEHYSLRVAPSVISSHAEYEKRCKALQITPYSLQSFAAEKRKADQRKLTAGRKGPRSEYSEYGTTPFTSLTRDTPPHGDHSMHVGHIDHTEMDVFATNPFNEMRYRPWLTTFILAYCRLVIAYWITFSKPKTESVLMVMRICLKRFGRLPQVIVVDGGKEMAGDTIALLQPHFRFTSKIRPPHQARFGSPLESMFHSANCHLIHNLEGNSKMTKNVREVTKSNDPRNLATLSLPDLDNKVRNYFQVVAPNVPHPELLTTPNKSYKEGLSRMGARSHIHFPYNENLERLLSPLVEGVTRRATRNGVKYQHHWYYNSVVLAHIGDDLEVRENTGDCREVFVKIGKQMYVFQCRARFRFFDITPGHESMVSQLVVTEQARIQGERSGKIHAGMAGNLPPDAEGVPTPIDTATVVTASQTVDTTPTISTDGSVFSASSDAPTKAIVAPPMTHHPAPSLETKLRGKKSKPAKPNKSVSGLFNPNEPAKIKLKVFKLK